ncbi:MAG: M23 family metallopeptidase, partial [Paraclostridium sp.]
QSLNNIRRELNPYDGMYEGEVESLKPALTDKLFNSKYGLISKKLSENLVAEMFNGKTQNIDIRISSFMKTMYRTLIFDLFKNTENTSFLKTIKETSTYITTEGINFLLIREHVALAVKEYLNQAITIIKNKTFISDATTLVLNELTDANNLKTEGYTFKNINEYLITLTDEIANELTYNYASIERIIDKTMGYFLTQLAYSLTFLHINYAENAKSEGVSIDSIIKSHIISSSMIGLFSIKTKYRTHHLGYAYDSSAKIVSKVLNSFFYLYKKKFLKPDGEGKLIEKTEEEILEGYFSGEINKSFYKDKVKFNFMNVERKIINEQNKDYNFIFGQPIKNYGITMFLNDIFTETSELSGLNNDVERYLLTKFTQFENGEKFCDIIDPIDYGYGPTQTEKPLSYKIDNITENGKINNIMKKRLIGDCDVFNDLKKINRIVNNPVFDVMPDYEVLIKKRDLEYEGVVDSRNDFKITSAFLLKNVLRVSVMVDPKTKIKTATVTSVDSSKRILDMTRDGSIAVQVSTSKNVSTTKKDEKNGELDYNIETKDMVELFTIEAGDVIEIRLGSYKNKQFINEGFEEDFRKSIVFKGTISKISNMSNIIEISGVGNASLLYSTHHKSVVMGTEGLFTKAKNFITTVFKIGSNRGATSTGDEINQYKNNKTANNHLFNIIKNKDDFNEVFKNNERGSMYNAAHFALGSLPTIASNLITGGDLASSGLAMRKFITSQIDSPFGVVTEIEDPRSKAIDPNIYRNVYNVDKDYDTYGAQYYDMSALGNAAPKEYDENGNKIVDLEYKIKESTDKVKEEIYIANQNTAGESGSGGVGNETSTNLNENVDFIWPTKSRRITSGYQFNREHPVTKKRKDHLAIDIGRVTNSKGEFISGKNYVYASRSGVCSYGKTNNSGNYVSIDHSYSQNGKTVTCSTFYCHLESSDVYNGKKVKAGDVIGVMGGTGLSSGIHLHFAITINGTKVNPVNYLKEVE